MVAHRTRHPGSKFHSVNREARSSKAVSLGGGWTSLKPSFQFRLGIRPHSPSGGLSGLLHHTLVSAVFDTSQGRTLG